MNKEEKRLIAEIIVLTVLLLIVVPVCVNASQGYKERKDILMTGVGTSVDITYNGDKKKITIYSRYDKEVRVNLIFKMTKSVNDYEILFGDETYALKDLEQTSDEEYVYYNLGVYDVLEERAFDFKLVPMNENRESETITYSFITEGLFNGL